MRKKQIAVFLIVILVITMTEPVKISAISQNEVEVKLNSLINQYRGTTWNDNYYGIQCKGFANLIFSKLFGVYIGPYDSATKSYIPNPNGAYEVGRLDSSHMSADGAKNILLKGMPGDYIQVRRRNKTYGHTMILVGTDSGGITVFDCNSDGKNGVRTYYIDWNTFYNKNSAMSLYHANDYTVSAPITDSCNCNESYKGNYTVTTEQYSLNMRSGHGTGYSVVTAIPRGEQVYVSKSDGTWAHVEWNGYSGYCSMEYLTKVNEVAPNLHIWISDSKMGGVPEKFKPGVDYYLCYELKDGNTGKKINEISDSNYVVNETIYGPDGNVVHQCNYEKSDYNWISLRAYDVGTYRGVVTISGDYTGTMEVSYELRANKAEEVQILNSKDCYCDNLFIKNIGETIVLKAKVIPEDAENKTVTWSSDNPSVVSVDESGKLTAKAEGKATIKVITEDGKHSDSCVVTVKTKGIIYGDINQDGAITATDLSTINQAVVGNIQLTEEEIMIADLNGDGKVSLIDSSLLLRYMNKEITSFPVEQQLSEIVISTMPKKTTYYIGDTITTEGITIKAFYNNGTSKDIKDFKVNGSTSVAGRQQVTISYTEAGITKSTSYQIYVKQKEVIDATMIPVVNPIETMKPTIVPTKTPQKPTMIPTKKPQEPTMIPTKNPQEPTMIPTKIPQSPTTPTNTISPTIVPTITPIINPTVEPISPTNPADIPTRETEDPDLEDLEEDDLESDTEKALEKGDLFEVKGITYEVTNASEENPTAECIGSASNKNKTIIIPAKVTYEDTDYKITGIAKNAFKNNKRITTVTIGSNVTYIGAYAFYGNSKLKTVKIKSQKIKSIQKKAFFGMSKKVIVKVPANAKSKYKKMLKNAGLGKR